MLDNLDRITPFNFLRYLSFREAPEVNVFWIEITPVPSRSRLFNWVMDAVGTFITLGFLMLKILFLGSIPRSFCFLSEKVLSFEF
jgi:hypothetical protein